MKIVEEELCNLIEQRHYTTDGILLFRIEEKNLWHILQIDCSW